MTIQTRELAQRLIAIKNAPLSFRGFISAAFPKFQIAAFQEELIETLDLLERRKLGKRNLLITMPPRHGKALSHSTPIYTPDGWRTHGDLRPGDYVYHPDGSPIKVVAVSDTDTEATLQLNLVGASPIRAHPEHEWLVKLNPFTYERIMTTAQIKEYMDKSTHPPFAYPLRIARRALPINMPHADLPIDPYFFGVWLGDGSSEMPRITCSKEDLPVILDGIEISSKHVYKNQSVISAYVKNMATKLRLLGVLNKKHIPSLYMNASTEQRLSLLAGIIDTDGSVNNGTAIDRVRIVTGSEALAEQIRTLCLLTGYRATINKSKPHPKTGNHWYTISFTGDERLPTKLKRKQIKPRILPSDGHSIKSVTVCAPEPSRCIQVDAPDGLYVAGHSFIVTHNSTITTVGFPAYFMLRNPEREVLSVSYGADLASKFGREVRDLTREPIIKQSFPKFSLSESSSAADHWSTEAGGVYHACGLNGSTTGRAANLLLIDDPIKNRVEADSASNRNKVYSYYTSALVNRKQPEINGDLPIEILIQTRWHPDDLAGRLMDSEDWADGDWHHINFPAISLRKTSVLISRKDLPPTDPDYLPQQQLVLLPPSQQRVPLVEEQALWPERFPLETLRKMQRRDAREFAALYQQEPFVAGGNIIKSQWFNTFDNDTCPKSFHTVIMAVDTAFKTKSQNDPSVIMVAAIAHTGDIYILDVQTHRLDYPNLKRKLIAENALWRGRALRGIYIEDKASGQSIVQDLRVTPGISVIPYKYHGPRDASDKVARINSVLPLIEGGRVFLPSDAPWYDAFIEESQSFPNGKHDDQVDALAIALDVLSRIGIGTSSSFPEFSVADSLNNAYKSSTGSFASQITNNFSKPLGEL